MTGVSQWVTDIAVLLTVIITLAAYVGGALFLALLMLAVVAPNTTCKLLRGEIGKEERE